MKKLIIFFIIFITAISASWLVVLAVTNIIPDNPPEYTQWAWNDSIGWIDFYGTNNVFVDETELRGWASSTVEEIILNCQTTPAGDICGQSNFKVTNNTSTNELGGFAWNDGVGWISFNCLNDNCLESNYKVSVDPSTGIFSGWAWNNDVGWFSFNCAGPPDTCGTSNYKVKTSWTNYPAEGTLISSIFDSQVEGGSAINTIMWQGTQPSGTNVFFRIAAANCSNGATNSPTCDTGVGWGGDKLTGDGAFVGPGGPNCSVGDFYNPGGPNIQSKIDLTCHTDKRYWRYKVILETDTGRTVGPTVTDIIINWSP